MTSRKSQDTAVLPRLEGATLSCRRERGIESRKGLKPTVFRSPALPTSRQLNHRAIDRDDLT
jgi:hypothetical protein